MFSQKAQSSLRAYEDPGKKFMALVYLNASLTSALSAIYEKRVIIKSKDGKQENFI
jgi:hypothetical protein